MKFMRITLLSLTALLVPVAVGAQEAQPRTPSQPQQGQESAQLNDNEISGIVAAANKGEVEQAMLAQTKAKDARVRKFAAHMVADHTDAEKRETQLIQKAGLKNEESPVSTQLTNDSTRLMESLKTQNGPEFDRTYIDAQVKEHQQLLDMIDHKFMANVKSPELKSFLQTLRPKIEMHLRNAKEIQKSMAK